MHPIPASSTASRRQNGFTIIELMVTLVIVGILAMLAAPSFTDLILSTRIKNGASDIYGALVLARSEAIKRGTNVTVTPADASPLPLSWANGWKVEAGTTLLRSQDALSNLKVECPAGTTCASIITYRRDGRLSGNTAFSIVVDEATPPSERRVAMRCVTINVSGQVNVSADSNMDGNCANG